MERRQHFRLLGAVLSAALLLFGIICFFHFFNRPISESKSLDVGSIATKTRGRARRAPPPEIGLIEQRLRSPDPVDQKAAVAALHEIADARPDELAAHFLTLLRPLIQANAFADVDELALLAILRRPQDTPMVVGAQKARVEAMLSMHQDANALREAKSFYNVCLLRDTGLAVQMLERAASKSRPELPSAIEAEFRSGAVDSLALAGSLPCFASISANEAPFAAAIKERQSPTKFDEFVAYGNLCLLAGRGADAERAFISASRARGSKTKDNGFFMAVEGVARAIRCETGAVGPANAFIESLMLGERPSILDSSVDQIWTRGDFQIAGQRIILAQLSPAPSEASTTAPSTSDEDIAVETSESLTSGGADSTRACDLGVPSIIAVLAPQPDRDLVSWLRAHEASGVGVSTTLVSTAGQAGLRSILEQTKLPSILLFHLGHAFQFKTKDYVTAALFYKAGAERVGKELETAPDAVRRAAIVRSMKDHLGGFRRVLWTVGRTDKSAIDALFRIYTSYVHWAPSDDASLLKLVGHLKVGAAECLNVEHRSDEAIQVLETLSASEIKKGGLQSSLDWQYAVALYESGRYAESVPKFESAARSPRYAADAAPLASQAKALSRELVDRRNATARQLKMPDTD